VTVSGARDTNAPAPLALRILAVYLAATVVPAIRGGVRGEGAWPFAVAHVVLLAISLMLISRRANSSAAAWLPLLAVPVLYASLPTLIAGLDGRMHDGVVQGWEGGVFGQSPAATLAGRYPYRGISELLHLAYLSYYPVIYLPPLLLFLRGQRPAFDRTTAALVTTYAVCFAVFVVFPVEGPRFAWAPPAGIPDGPVRRFTLRLLAAGSSRGAAFPSSHVAVAVTQAVVALRCQRAVGIVVSVCAALLSLGAVYGGFHYGIDVLAGAAVGLLIGSGFLLR